MTDDALQQVIDRIPFSWGKYVSCGPGWDDLIEQLDKSLAELDSDYIVHQCKEKLGGLRYYTETKLPGSSERRKKFFDLIRQAEFQSYSICESCGEKAEDENNDIQGWIVTLCSTCLAKRIKATS